jgi:hypothetical protein
MSKEIKKKDTTTSKEVNKKDTTVSKKVSTPTLNNMMLYTGNKSEKILTQLKKLFEEGWINIENSIIKSEFSTNKHKEMIENWIDVYEKYDNEIKDQLKLHRNFCDPSGNSTVIQKFGDTPTNSDEYDCYVMLVRLSYGKLNEKNNKRKYTTLSCRMKIQSDSYRNYIKNYPVELASIVFKNYF